MTPWFLPRYGAGALSDVVPSLLAGLGVPGPPPVLALPEARKVCLLLVDGLGWQLLRAHPEDAPFLNSLAGNEITAGFPATTATSLTSIGTGVPSGQHGIVGYSFAADQDELINALGWNRHADHGNVDFRDRYVPEEFQPVPTTFQRAADHGVHVRVLSSHLQGRSGLTRAAYRGATYDGVFALGDIASKAVAALHAADRVLCYAYHAELDLLGHVYGPGSTAWRFQLRQVDRLAATIADRLPGGGLLAVTADHGMVHVPEEDRIDYDRTPALQAGVRMLGGEPRVRHLYTDSPEVLQTWRELLGDRAWVLPRDEAIAAGWFGPSVAPHARARIGDVVAAMRGTTTVVRTQQEALMAGLLGQHGSLTEAEQLIPLLTAVG
ncbi:hypothetical protein JOF53_005529 [Crossiella equi]|uniref:Alkaline phosphatase family protein n=1 Tax=Crossiella equi TaxID=130796 RepID=A0ABS5AK77_9PSEU|nr:nucleotide pyrophosphatase/phosphodiesterase family protein [Crossiella equi]MBP2476657.1 hypothetical protein [Crossiella equi]